MACIVFYNKDITTDGYYEAELAFRKRIFWASMIGTTLGLIIAYLTKIATFLLSLYGCLCLGLVTYEAALFYVGE